jgi:hypothetical protein
VPIWRARSRSRMRSPRSRRPRTGPSRNSAPRHLRQRPLARLGEVDLRRRPVEDAEDPVVIVEREPLAVLFPDRPRGAHHVRSATGGASVESGRSGARQRITRRIARRICAFSGSRAAL